MADSVRPHRQQPTRLPCPWDSPGKNTGVGCHFLLQCMKVKSESEVAQLCLTLCDPMGCSLPGSSVHGIFQARVLEWGAIAFSGRTVWRFLKKLEIELPYNNLGPLKDRLLPRSRLWLASRWFLSGTLPSRSPNPHSDARERLPCLVLPSLWSRQSWK